MMLAFNRMKEIGGGIVIMENGKSLKNFHSIKRTHVRQNYRGINCRTKRIWEYMKEKGYQFETLSNTVIFFDNPFALYSNYTAGFI